MSRVRQAAATAKIIPYNSVQLGETCCPLSPREDFAPKTSFYPFHSFLHGCSSLVSDSLLLSALLNVDVHVLILPISFYMFHEDFEDILVSVLVMSLEFLNLNSSFSDPSKSSVSFSLSVRESEEFKSSGFPLPTPTLYFSTFLFFPSLV